MEELFEVGAFEGKGVENGTRKKFFEDVVQKISEKKIFKYCQVPEDGQIVSLNVRENEKNLGFLRKRS